MAIPTIDAQGARRAAAPSPAATAGPRGSRPNILLILADDLGYSDIGAFGSEIATPHLDALAQAGMTLTNFHAGPVCNITRLQLMSGIDNNVAVDPHGASNATRTALRKDALTIAEALQPAGYRTYLSGKWDVGQRPDQTPFARGFERSFALLPATASHYNEKHPPKRHPIYWAHDDLVEVSEDFYSSAFYTDKLMEFLRADEASDRPFFAYLSYTAPHFPLQAPAEYIDRYAGIYDQGYEPIRRARLARMKASGVLSPQSGDSPFPETMFSWDRWPSDEERKLEARRMQVYAGMIELMDEQVGRLVAYLKETGQFHDTLIIFTSDNGANATWTPPVHVDFGNGRPDNRLENLGKRGSYMAAGSGWGWVSGAPFRGFKMSGWEGGHSVPALAVLPGRIEAGSMSRAFLTVRDLLPTFLDAACSDLPKTNPQGQASVSLDGRSALPLLTGHADASPHAGAAVGFHDKNASYLFKDSWKIVRDPEKGWQLFDLADDREETTDLSQGRPEKLEELLADWKIHGDRVAARRAS